MTIKTFLSLPYIKDEDSFAKYSKNEELFFDVRYIYEDEFLKCKLRITADKRQELAFVHFLYFYKTNPDNKIYNIFHKNFLSNFYVFPDSKILIYNLRDA